jgi:hypothetical protein
MHCWATAATGLNHEEGRYRSSNARIQNRKGVSYKSKAAESNYEIHDKKLLAIVPAMEEWRGELIGVENPFVVLSDHKNLQYFMITRKLSERQVRWSLKFS